MEERPLLHPHAPQYEEMADKYLEKDVMTPTLPTETDATRVVKWRLDMLALEAVLQILRPVRLFEGMASESA